MAKVSVIVPVYNVEPYIERCATSLMEQTLDDLEYVFVDDASPDGSIKILERVIERYPGRKQYVRILAHDKNRGLPAARLTGLKQASGDYIIHCDSDDYVDRNMYLQMYEFAVEGKYDMVVSDLFEGSEGDFRHKLGMCSEKGLLKSMFEGCPSSVWNKMVKAEIAKDSSIVFPADNMAEDVAQTFQHALLAKRIGYLAKPLYYYERRQSSILGNRNPEAMLAKTEQFVRNFDIVLSALEREGRSNEFKGDILHEKVYIKNHLLPALPFIPCYKIWINTYKEVNSKVLFSHMFTFREKLNFMITYLGLYPLYYNLTHRNA